MNKTQYKTEEVEFHGAAYVKYKKVTPRVNDAMINLSKSLAGQYFKMILIPVTEDEYFDNKKEESQKINERRIKKIAEQERSTEDLLSQEA